MNWSGNKNKSFHYYSQYSDHTLNNSLSFFTGEGKMGVSNALGANTMNILLSLGMPWFIKTLVLEAGDEGNTIQISSGSMEYTVLGLLFVALTLYISLVFSKFKLSRLSGAITLACYFGFLALAIVADTVLFESSCVGT